MRNLKCFVFVVALFLPFKLFSIEANNFIFPSLYSPFLSEIHEIEFQGNYSLPSATLLNVLTSRTSQKSIPHKVLYFYYDNVSKNRATPKILTSVLRSIVLSLINEVSFYKEILVEQDKRNIELYYYQNGFHEVKVQHVFFADTIRKKNILRFIITENPRYTINYISYSGLEQLSFEVRKKLENLRLLKTGTYFNELLLANELRSIRTFLRENGYFYAEYSTPKVVIDTTNKVDSIFINFKLGSIVKINRINFLDSTFEQKRVGYNVKYNHLDIKPGDIFSQSKILSAELNLNSLGTFELVRIDTSSLFAPNTDTTLNLVVFLRYKKMRDFSVGLFTNRNLVEKTVNLGAEFNISDKNIFGGGQSANFYVRGFAIDVNKVIFENKSLEYEFQTGINFVQPLLWVIGNTRIALAGSILYSQRKVFSSLQLKTFSFPVKFTTRLPFWTYFNYLDLDLFFERQVPKIFLLHRSDFTKMPIRF
ncbi:MAG: POTRA domain-containing protein [Candidatus Kapaibacteriota bacterium]